MTAPSAEELLAHADWLHQLARALVGDGAAGDVVQETYEVALAKPPPREGPLRPWLGGVARNLAKMTLRGRTRRQQREEAIRDAVPEVPTSETLVERARMHQKVAAIVLDLPVALRDVLLLRFFEGMSAAEIARAQGIPGATVRSRLSDALLRVREALDAEHAGDRRAWAVVLAPLPIVSTAARSAVVAGGIVVKIKVVIGIFVVALAALLGTRALGWWGASAADVVTPPPPVVAVGRGSAPAPAPRAESTTLVGARLPAVGHDDDPRGTIRLEGQVIDDTDKPVGGAQVAIDANPTRTVVTEADGSFAFDGLITRDYRLEATAHTGDHAWYAGPARVRLAPNPEPVTLRMREGGTVEVVVTDVAAGSPVAGAIVELRSTLVWSATTDGKGIATLHGVGPTWAPLAARATGFAPAAMMMYTAGDPAAPSRVALALAKGAPLAGKVVDDKGKPIAGARVVATSASEPFPVVDARRDGVESKADGSFVFTTVAAGTWRVTATQGDHGPATSAPITVDGTHERTDLELVLADGAVIRGVVKDGSGAPVSAADVRVVVRGHTFWRAQRQAFTDADGTFSITGLPRRAVDVVAAHASGATAIVSVDLAADAAKQLALVLDVTGAITGTVVDSHGQPVGDAQVIAEPAWSGGTTDRQAWSVRGIPEIITDQGGAFRFAGLPAGRYRVRAARPGASEAALDLAASTEASPGGAPLKLVVSADGSIVGKVVLADGSIPLAFTVALGGSAPAPFATADGSFKLPAIVGTHTLVVDGRRFLVAKAKDVTVKAGVPTDVGTITVQPGRSVSGRVLDEAGVPVANAKVAAGALLTGGGTELYIPDESIGAKDTVTDATGNFTIEGFPPSSLTIIAGKDAVGRSTSIRLAPGPDSVTLSLVLQPTTGLDGTITRDGKPLADTIVIANPIGASAAFFVQSGPDGTFALDALAPGPYVIYPMIGGGGSKPKDMYLRRVEVVVGTRAKVTIDATPGPVTLSVAVKTDAGAPAPMAMVIAVAAKVSPTSSNDLRELDQLAPTGDTPLPVYIRGAIGGPAEIAGMRAGLHTICAAPPPSGDPGALAPVVCQTLTLTPAAKQSITLTVPAAWYAGK